MAAATPLNKVARKRPSGTSLQENEDDVTNWEGFHDYMTLKRRKLRSQVELVGKQKSAIFEGVTIYFNGYTNPNTDILKEKIHTFGGLYEYALLPNVTHVIATNLPTAKIRNLGNSAIVCRPEWIIDSIENGEQLPVDDYLLYRPSRQQKKIVFDQVVGSSSASTSSVKTSTPSAKTSAKDFVNEFYSNSRLHYLSTWSKELKEFTSRVLPSARQIIPMLGSGESLRERFTHVIVHVDIDCFFVSVSLLDKPHLVGKPVAVTHAKNSSFSPSKQQDNSMSDIASCSYEAREAGVKNGMSVGNALNKCPELVLVSYDFDKYRVVSQTFYEVLISYSHLVEAVSCDEAFIELTDYARDVHDVMEIVKQLRADVLAKTGCNVSAGISHNMLLARLATRKAKPNGQFVLTEEEAKVYLPLQPVCVLPGIGWALNRRLSDFNIETCGQLQLIPLTTLKERHGTKTGEMLYYFCRGIDSRELKLKSEAKSLSVDINFGIRFKEITEAEELLQQLAKELERRAEESGVKGECVCLKLKVRKASASSITKKYLGHGPCDNISRSFNLLVPTQNGIEVGRIVCRLLRQVNPVASDIRGMGIQLTKLVSQAGQSMKPENMDIRSMMGKVRTGGEKSEQIAVPILDSPIQCSSKEGATSTLNESVYNLPSVDDLDESVLLALPPDLQEKILNEYSSKPFNTTAKTSSVMSQLPSQSPEQSQHGDFQVVRISYNVQDQYVCDLRNNLRKWVAESKSGPTLAETESFHDYVCWLTEANVEVVYLALKCLKRVIVSRQLVKEWASLFNSSLAIVQSKLQTHYHHSLLELPLLCSCSKNLS